MKRLLFILMCFIGLTCSAQVAFISGGTDLWTSIMDSGKGLFTSDVEDWSTFGNNTVAQSGGALVITYVDNVQGGYVNILESGDFTEDLIESTTYRVRALVKVNAGSLNLRVRNLAGDYSVSSAITNTDYAWISFTFDSSSGATVPNLRGLNFSAGEILYIDQYIIER